MKLLALGTLALCGTLYYLTHSPSSTPQPLFLATSADPAIEQAFLDFLAKYGRSYSSRSEAGTRYQAFRENYLAIQKHEGREGYTLGVNQFSDMTEGEFLDTYGRGLHEGRRLSSSSTSDEYVEYDERGRYHCRHDDELHDYFDYNDYGYIDESLKSCGTEVDWLAMGKVGKVKQQSTCGSCWAHSTIATVETMHAQQHSVNDTDKVISFSEQQLVDCDFLPNIGCLGGRRQFTFNYV